MSDQDYQKHLENLQCEFQRIVELTDIIKISEEMRSRIGTTLKAMLQYSPDLFSSLDKDVFRTDRLIDYYHPNPSTIEQDLKSGSLRILQQILLAYHAYDPDLEYVQGMADLLSPILYILRDETETFWIFAKFMERQRCNFTIDGKGVQEKIDKIEGILKLLDPQFYDFLGFQKDSSQLLFCYRWLLVLFKREFSFHDTLLIWEVILTAPVTDYEVYISVAILLMAKQTIMDNCRDFGEILTHLSEFTKHLSVFEVLSKTDRILHFIQTDPHLRTLIENRRFQP